MKSYIEMLNSDKYELFTINQSYRQGDVANQTLIDIKGKGIICFVYTLLNHGYYSTTLDVEIGIDGTKISTHNISGSDTSNTLASYVFDSCYKKISYFTNTFIQFDSYVESTSIYRDTTSELFFQNGFLNSKQHFSKPLLFNNSFYYKVVSYDDGYRDRHSAGNATILLLGFKLKE